MHARAAMANQNRNGRDVALPDENQPSWRPDDQDSGEWEGIEHHGQGQSGYAAGRYEGDRSYGSRSEYGRSGQWDAYRGGGYLGQSGQQMGYGGSFNRDQHWTDRQQPASTGGRGAQGQGGMYGQGGYQEGMVGRGGPQDRYGSQGYQGWDQERSQRGSSMSGYGGEQGPWMGDARNQRWTPGTSGMGYGHQREHDMPFRSGMGMSPSYGSHRGKGPQGYVRSDERIREIVCDCLTDDHHVDASNIEVSVQNGEVTLSGRVDDRQQKRRAEDIIEHLSGVKDVINNLRIASQSMSASSGNGAGTSNDASAVNVSGREQAQQSGSDRRHRA